MEELLAQLSKQLSELEAREKAGEDVSAQKEALEAEKKRVEAASVAANDDETEVEKLRRELRQRQRVDLAKAIGREIVEKIRDEQAKEHKELVELVRQEVADMLGGGDIESVVKNAIKSVRSGSRFVGTDASEEFVNHVASGGSATTAKKPSIRVEETGAKTEAKDILESKSLGRFFNIIARASSNPYSLTDGEKHFLAYSRKAMAEMTDSSGGYLIPQDWMPDILGLLRAQAVVRKAGPRIIPFNKQMNQTSISSGATAGYTGENNRITPSEMTFAETPLLTPKNLTALVPVSNYLLADAASAEEIIRADMIEVMALREDLAFLRDNGSGGAPIGLRNISGATINPLTVPTNGFQPTIGDLRKIRAVFRNTNSGPVRLVWFFAPQFLAYLETLTDADGRFLLDSNLLQLEDGGMNGMLDGIPFYTSTQIPVNLTVGSSTNATDLMLVNMAETVVGMNMELEVAVSTEASWTSDGTNWNSAFQQNQTLFRTVLRHDINHRRPAQIIVQTGVLV